MVPNWGVLLGLAISVERFQTAEGRRSRLSALTLRLGDRDPLCSPQGATCLRFLPTMVGPHQMEVALKQHDQTLELLVL